MPRDVCALELLRQREMITLYEFPQRHSDDLCLIHEPTIFHQDVHLLRDPFRQINCDRLHRIFLPTAYFSSPWSIHHPGTNCSTAERGRQPGGGGGSVSQSAEIRFVSAAARRRLKLTGSAGENRLQAGCWAPNSPVSRFAAGFCLLSQRSKPLGDGQLGRHRTAFARRKYRTHFQPEAIHYRARKWCKGSRPSIFCDVEFSKSVCDFSAAEFLCRVPQFHCERREFFRAKL